MSYALLKFGTVYNLLEAGARRVASAKGAKSKHSFDIQVSTLHTSGMNAIVSRSLDLQLCQQASHLAREHNAFCLDRCAHSSPSIMLTACHSQHTFCMLICTWCGLQVVLRACAEPMLGRNVLS